MTIEERVAKLEADVQLTVTWARTHWLIVTAGACVLSFFIGHLWH